MSASVENIRQGEEVEQEQPVAQQPRQRRTVKKETDSQSEQQGFLLNREWADRLVDSLGVGQGWKRTLKNMENTITATAEPLIVKAKPILAKAQPYLNLVSEKASPIMNQVSAKASPVLSQAKQGLQPIMAKATTLKSDLMVSANKMASDLAKKIDFNNRMTQAHQKLPQRLQPLAQQAAESGMAGLRSSQSWLASQTDSMKEMIFDLGESQKLPLQAGLGLFTFTTCFVPILFLNTPEARMVLLAFLTSLALATAAYRYRSGVSPLMTVACASWIPLLFYLWTVGGMGDKYSVEMALALEKGQGVTPQSLRVGTRWYVFVLWLRFVLMGLSAALPTVATIAWKQLRELKDDQVFGADLKNLSMDDVKAQAQIKLQSAKRSVKSAVNQVQASAASGDAQRQFNSMKNQAVNKMGELKSQAQDLKNQATEKVNDAVQNVKASPSPKSSPRSKQTSKAESLKQSMARNANIMSHAAKDKAQQTQVKAQDVKEVVADKASQAQDSLSEKVSQAKEVLTEKASQAKEVLTEKANQAKEIASEKSIELKKKAVVAKDQAMDKASELQSQASDLKEQAVEKASDLKDQASVKATEVKGQVSEAVEQASNDSSSKVADLKSKASDLKEQAVNKATELKTQATEKVNEQSSEVTEVHHLDQNKVNKLEKLLADHNAVGGTGLGASSGLNLDKSVSIAPAVVDKDVTAASKLACVVPNCTDSRVSRGYCLTHASQATQIAHPNLSQSHLSQVPPAS